jgi:hypothetical protein
VVVLVLLALASCVGTETRPGVKTCVHFLIYSQCAEGPPWGPPFPPGARYADQPKPEVARAARSMARPALFYCYASASDRNVGGCASDREVCEESRASVLDVVPDAGACVAAESAWCSGEKCAPTKRSCASQRAGADDESAPECREVR